MNKVCSLLYLIMLFQQLSFGLESSETANDPNNLSADVKMKEWRTFYDSLPTLSDFESHYKKIQNPTDQMKLAYCDMLSNSLLVGESYNRQDLMEICRYFGENIETVNLSVKEKCRILALGILLSTSMGQELSFAEKLESIDPDNALITVIKLKNSILYQNFKESEQLIEQFTKQKCCDFYIEQGYLNRYSIWTSFFGKNLPAFYSLHISQHDGLVLHAIWRNATILWTYDVRNKYRRSNMVYEGIPLVDYFSLDQLFLYKTKMSRDDFGWIASIANIQLNFFYRIYQDTTLEYASGINFSEHNFGRQDIEEAKQKWFNYRDQLQQILYEQRKEIYDIIKFSTLIVQKIESYDSTADNKFIKYLKLYTQGKETQFLNDLNEYDSSFDNNIVDRQIKPLKEKEDQLWKNLLSENNQIQKILNK